MTTRFAMTLSCGEFPYTTHVEGAKIGRMITRHLIIEGLVQGVGYRAVMGVEAQRLGLSGWVRNRTDGSVEAVVQGPGAMIELLVAWARHGPPAARVSAVRVAAVEAGQARGFTGFEQLRTA
jgi:acylphosphatase